jgi:aminoglycoside 3-N-acetyltransferase I
MQIQTLASATDFEALLRVYETVFMWEDFTHQSTEYLENILQNPQFLGIIAKIDQQVVGGLTAHILPSYQTGKLIAYIYDVGVLPAFQRQGIGKALIHFLMAYCKENGFEEAFVQAEFDDEGAIAFYRKTQMNDEMPALQFAKTF